MHTRLIRSIAMTTLALLASQASAAVRVGLVTNGLSTPDEIDILAYLNADARLGPVTLYDANVSVPTLSALQANTDAVLFITDSFGENTALHVPLGDMLADYVDSGRGVLLASFAFNPTGGGLGVSGRIMTPGYSPIANQSGQGSGGTLSLSLSNMSHPTMQNVASFSSDFDNNVASLQGAGSSAIAYYTDGEILLAENAAGNVLALSAFPSPGISRNDTFLTGNYANLVTNALVYSVVPEPATLGVIAVGLVGFSRRRTHR